MAIIKLQVDGGKLNNPISFNSLKPFFFTSITCIMRKKITTKQRAAVLSPAAVISVSCEVAARFNNSNRMSFG